MLVLEAAAGFVNQLSFGPDGRFLVARVSADAGGVFVWDLANPTEPRRVAKVGELFGFLEDGRAVVGADLSTPLGATRLTGIDPDTGKSALLRDVPGAWRGTVLPGDRVFVINNGEWQVWGAGDAPLRAGASTGSAFAVDTEGTRLAVARGVPGATRRHEVVAQRLDGPGETVSEPGPGEVHAIAFSPDGEFLVAEATLRLLVRNATSLKWPAQLRAADTTLFRCPRFHPSGRFVAAGGANVGGGVYSWDAGTWRENRAYSWPVGPVTALAFAPDGSVAAAGGEKGRVTVWDVD